MRWVVFYLFLLFSFGSFGQSYTIETVPNVHAQNARAYVSNPDGILNSATVEQLNQMLYNLEQTNTTEFAIVVLNSIGDADERMFANKLFEKWGIGKKENDNGLLLLFVKDRRRALTEVGYGLEGVLPDAINKRLLTRYMLPYFKEGNYNQGMLEGVKAFIQYMTTAEANEELTAVAEPQKGTSWWTVLFWYFLASVIVCVVLILSLRGSLKHAFQGSDYSKYRILTGKHKTILPLCFVFPLTILPLRWWIKKRMRGYRNKPQHCDYCDRKMHKLSEQEEDAYLSKSEQAEEKINSIDYDVWLCDHCNKVKLLAYESQYTKYTRCPKCHTKAFILQEDKVLSSPTHLSKGVGEKRYECQFCHYKHQQRYWLPILVAPIVTGGGNRFGGGFGGGIGGGFGGGSSGGGGGSIGW